MLVQEQKNGLSQGIASYCTANEWVIMAGMDKLKDSDLPLLLEASANQVNRYGGYTGMTPADFQAFVHKLAAAMDFPTERLILDGDHLGPLTWKDRPAAAAMAESHTLIRD